MGPFEPFAASLTPLALPMTIGNRVELLTRVWAPDSGADTQDLSTLVPGYGVCFGPFQVGDIVRIAAGVGNIWYGSRPNASRDGGTVYATAGLAARARGAAPLAAFDRVDYEIRSEGERWIACCLDTDSSAGTATVWVTGRVGAPCASF